MYYGFKISGSVFSEARMNFGGHGSEPSTIPINSCDFRMGSN
jgi:hypothetical protein